MIANLYNTSANFFFCTSETATMGLRDRLMGAALQLSGLFPQRHLETASQGTASSTPQGIDLYLFVLTVKVLILGIYVLEIYFFYLFLENHLLFCSGGKELSTADN